MRGVAGDTVERVRAALGARWRGAAGQARSEDGVERRGAGGGDPDGAVGESVRGRGAPEAEIKWLGIRSTPAYVGEPECNGVAERFIRTLKEECIYLNDFETLDEAREVIGAFVERYNSGWLLQRHGYLTPARAREKLSRRAA